MEKFNREVFRLMGMVLSYFSLRESLDIYLSVVVHPELVEEFTTAKRAKDIARK